MSGLTLGLLTLDMVDLEVRLPTMCLDRASITVICNVPQPEW